MSAQDADMEKHFIGSDRCAQVMNHQHVFIVAKNANTHGARISNTKYHKDYQNTIIYVHLTPGAAADEIISWEPKLGRAEVRVKAPADKNEANITN